MDGPTPTAGLLQSTPAPASGSVRPKRVLACTICQQKKLGCDRKFPCSNCIRSRQRCVQATLAPRRQRRKFPKRELLDRLRAYEDLLRQNNVDFEPLNHDSFEDKASLNGKAPHEQRISFGSDNEQSPRSPSTISQSEKTYEAK
jgi:Fungal Zn(2)-Cys(6) binuclear cluster domain